MIKQISLLCRLQLYNVFGINELRHTTDAKKKRNCWLMLFVWGYLGVYTLFGVTTVSVLMCEFGMGDMIPICLYAATSIVILLFSLMKAGGTIFEQSSFEVFMSLPMSKTAIVLSRFLRMYLADLGMSAVAMIVGMVIYSIYIPVSASFVVANLIGIFLLPLLPLTISTIIGSVATAISSRMKHKSLGSGIFSILLSLIILVGCFSFTNGTADISDAEILDLIVQVKQIIGRVFPPATMFGEAATEGKILPFALLAVGTVLVFVLMIVLIQKYFFAISAAIHATSAKNNYKMRELHINSPFAAVWKRELKRYFSSSLYMGNTLLGYILMPVATIALLVVGPQMIEDSMQIEGVVARGLPALLGVIGSIMPTTVCAISMEGKEWWITKTLPISTKTIMKSKVMVNLVVAAPFYLVSVVTGCIAIEASLTEAMWMIVMPALHIVLLSMAGLFINLLLPLMEWENEARVIKQSSASFIIIFANFFVAVPAIVGALACTGMVYHIVMSVIAIIYILLISLFYVIISKKSLLTI